LTTSRATLGGWLSGGRRIVATSPAGPGQCRRHDGGRRLVEIEVAAAEVDPGRNELEALRDIEVVIDELANVGIRIQARVAPADAPYSPKLPEGD
jgi:hypothetical protein